MNWFYNHIKERTLTCQQISEASPALDVVYNETDIIALQARALDVN